MKKHTSFLLGAVLGCIFYVSSNLISYWALCAESQVRLWWLSFIHVILLAVEILVLFYRYPSPKMVALRGGTGLVTWFVLVMIFAYSGIHLRIEKSLNISATAKNTAGIISLFVFLLYLAGNIICLFIAFVKHVLCKKKCVIQRNMKKDGPAA